MTKHSVFLEKLALNAARFLAIAVFPALLASFYRTFYEDQAYAVTLMHSVVYLMLVATGVKRFPLFFMGRISFMIVFTLLVSIGSMVRNETAGFAVGWVLFASVLFALINQSWLRYVIPVVFIGLLAFAAYLLDYHTTAESLSLFFGYSSITLASVYLIVGLLKDRSLLLEQQEGIIANLTQSQAEQKRVHTAAALEAARRDAVAHLANIAHFEFNFATGDISGDTVELARFGLPPDHGAFNFAEFAHVWPEEDLKTVQNAIGDMAGKPVGSTINFTHRQTVYPSEELRSFRVVGTNTLQNGQLVFMGASIDITDEKRASQQAQAITKKLQTEQDRQTHMYAVIGHELRTPAAAMKMLLDEASLTGSDVDQAILNSNVDQLIGVIDMLRNVAQPDKMSQSDKAPLILSHLLNAQMISLDTFAKTHGVALRTDFSELSNELLDLNQQLLKQLISNLLKNAVIHSDGDEVIVSAQSLQHEKTMSLTIRVADNGKGIASSDVEHLFDAYERGDSDRDGYGLGLYICREIAYALEGELSYEPNAGGGACFVLRFDAELSHEIRDTQTTGENVLQGLNVLVAEDNQMIQKLTDNLLKSAGAMVTLANDGQAAMATDLNRFDLILSDIFMPNMNGYEFVRAARAVGVSAPIVGLTSATIGQETDRMLAAGADIVLSKPVKLDQLEELLKKKTGS